MDAVPLAQRNQPDGQSCSHEHTYRRKGSGRHDLWPFRTVTLTRPRIIWAIRLACASLACTALFAIWGSGIPHRVTMRAKSSWLELGLWNETTSACSGGETPSLDPSLYVNGPPTGSFRDNLRPDVTYITSWGSGGWTNDVISVINLIYLGMITERVPIIPVFLPSQLLLTSVGDAHESPLAFSEVFDLPYLRNATRTPILEWRDVKALNTNAPRDELGCWNVWESIQYHVKAPRESFMPWYLKLEISYTKTPHWIKLKQNFEHDRYSTFWALASLAFPRTRQASLVPPLPSKKYNVSLPPDEQLLCFDFLFYLAAQQSDELELDYSPAWRFVGQHMRWTPRLQQLGSEYIWRTLGLHQDDPIPPFITVHVRHGDFIDWCQEGSEAPEDCFAPLSAIQRRVVEVQEELRERKGIEVSHVIMTSDEKNNAWWREVRELGWYSVDHTRTKELHGHWYPILIDALIASRSAGHIGTDRSTVSILSSRRVQSWQDGPVRMVKWGKPGADDH